MTEEQLSELLVHPRFQRFIDRRVQAELDRRKVPPFVVDRSAKKGKVAPEGYLTYAAAAQLHGIANQTIRYWVCRGMVKGGGGIVNEAALDAYVKVHKFRAKRTNKK